MGLKITVNMLQLGHILDRRHRETKKLNATSEESEQKQVPHMPPAYITPATSGPVPDTPLSSTHKEQAYSLPWGVSKQGALLFVLALLSCSRGLNKARQNFLPDL